MVPDLSAAELQVVALIAAGHTDRAVARLLGRSEHTVQRHVSAAMARTQAASRTELVARCYSSGLLTLSWPPSPSVLEGPCPDLSRDQQG